MNRLTGLLLATLLAACGQPGPSDLTAAPIISTPSPSPTVETAAVLSVQGSAKFCGSLGGCAYYGNLDGPGGPWDAELELRKGVPDSIAMVVETGLPPILPTGRYTVTLTSKLVSDLVSTGIRSRTRHRHMCGRLTVSPGQASVTVDAEFDFDTCAATVSS